jgi:hypothetical protein
MAYAFLDESILRKLSFKRSEADMKRPAAYSPPGHDKQADHEQARQPQ